MELEKLTALQLGEKTKTASGQRPGWSKTVLNRLRNRIQKYTLILTHIKKKHINVQKKYKKALRTVLIPVLLQVYRLRLR